MSADDKKKYFFICPEGFFIYKTNSAPDVPVDSESGDGFGGGSPSGLNKEDSDDTWNLGQVNQFGAIIRNSKTDEYISLKICPVGITTEQMTSYYVEVSPSGTTVHGAVYEKHGRLRFRCLH